MRPSFFWNYKNFDNSAFREALNRKLLKYDLNNIECDTLQEIIASLLNVYAPLKKKYFRANHASFVTKELRKAIMERTRLMRGLHGQIYSTFSLALILLTHKISI